MVFVILTWQELYIEDMMLAVNDTGRVLLFPSHKKAEEYAERNLQLEDY